MNQIIIGNILALAGASIMAGAGLLKKRRQILLAQCLQFGLMGSANLVLGGITGAVSAAVNIVRNLVCMKWAFTTPLKLIFIAALVLLGSAANSAGLLGLLPIASSCLYTWFLDVKDEQTLKAVIIFTLTFWVIYDFAIMNYVSFAFDLFSIFTNVMGILSLRRQRRGGDKCR